MNDLNRRAAIALYPGLVALCARLKRQRTLPALRREYYRAAARVGDSQLLSWALGQAFTEAGARLELRRQRRARPHNRKGRKAARMLVVGIYDCNRAYGGREEGGWWYDTGTLVAREGSFRNRDSAYAHASRLNAWCERDNDREQRRPIYSVLCDGVLQAHVMDAPAPAYFPTARPHYE